MKLTGPDLKTVLDVLSRDDHACVRCGTPARGDRGVQWVIHHRKPRGMGGTKDPAINYPSNLLTLCTDCHVFVEANRTEALDKGWLVAQWETPASRSVLVRHESAWVYLTLSAAYDKNGPGSRGHDADCETEYLGAEEWSPCRCEERAA